MGISVGFLVGLGLRHNQVVMVLGLWIEVFLWVFRWV